MGTEVFDRIRKGKTPINVPLTSISTAYFQGKSGGATSFFPEVPVQLSRASYYQFSKADLLRDNVSPKPILGKVDPTVIGYETDDYKCVPEQIILGYDDIIQSDVARMGAKGIMQLRQNKARVIAEQIFIHQNKVFAQKYFKKGVWGADLTGGVSVSSGSTDFVSFDNDNSDPIKFISDCITAMKKSTGRKPNKLGLGQRVFDALINHPDIMNRVIYGGNTASPAMVTTKSLAAILGVDEGVVFDAIWNSANLGEEENTDFICDENAMLLAYATPTPMIDEATAGYTFRWDMGTGNILPIIEWEGDKGTYSHYIGGMISQDMKVVCKDLGIYFQNAVTPEN